MFHPSQDADAFGYSRAYAQLHATLGLTLLAANARHQLPSVESFDITDGEHVCIAAFMGFPMLPFDRKSIDNAVGSEGAFTRTVTARVRDVEIRTREANRLLLCAGVQICYDPSSPTDPKEVELLRPFVGGFVDDLLQYHFDREYLRSGRSGKLNHLAREYRRANLGLLEDFVAELDSIASGWGYGSYANLCVPTRFIRHLEARSKQDASRSKALEAMNESRDHLKRHAPYVIEAFLASRSGEAEFKIDVTEDELKIDFDAEGLHIQETIAGAYIPNDDTGRLFEIMGFRA